MISSTDRSALVLAGGGLAGIAWETGVLTGLARAGVHLGDADTVIGTSAGATVGAQLRSGVDLEELLHDQLAGTEPELPGSQGVISVLSQLYWFLGRQDPTPGRRWFGTQALQGSVGNAAARRQVIEGRLSSPEWPERDLWVTAVDAHSGELRVFDRDSGVSLIDAVMASCAVPLVWPPVEIEGRHYIDGAIPSVANAHLAAGFSRVVVVALEKVPLMRHDSVSGVLRRLKIPRWCVVSSPRRALLRIGGNYLDPAVRQRAAEAGLREGVRCADRVRAVWAT